MAADLRWRWRVLALTTLFLGEMGRFWTGGRICGFWVVGGKGLGVGQGVNTFGGVRNFYCDLSIQKDLEGLTTNLTQKLIKLEANRQQILKIFKTNTSKDGNLTSIDQKINQVRQNRRATLRNLGAALLTSYHNNATDDIIQGNFTGGFGIPRRLETRWSQFSSLLDAASNETLTSVKSNITSEGAAAAALTVDSRDSQERIPVYKQSLDELKAAYEKVYGAFCHSSDRYYIAAKIRAKLASNPIGISVRTWRQGNGTIDARQGGSIFRTNDGRNLFIANRSGFKGVRLPRKVPKSKPAYYEATLSYLNREIHLGKFHTKEEAARAYDRANLKARGRKAFTNFPASDYDLDTLCGPKGSDDEEESDLLKSMKSAEMIVRVGEKLDGSVCGILPGKHRISKIVGTACYRNGIEYLRETRSVDIVKGIGVYVARKYKTLAALHKVLVRTVKKQQELEAAVTKGDTMESIDDHNKSNELADASGESRKRSSTSPGHQTPVAVAREVRYHKDTIS